MGQKQKIADEDGDNSDGGGKDERGGTMATKRNKIKQCKAKQNKAISIWLKLG